MVDALRARMFAHNGLQLYEVKVATTKLQYL